MIPHLDLATLVDLTTLSHTTDGDLLRRVPRDLAAYYQALPLAVEEGRVTVVTAHPDNQAAIEVLGRLLGAEVVPVAGSEAAVASAIQRLYPVAALHRQVYSWPGDSSWRARVRATADRTAHVLGLPVIHLDGDPRAPDLFKRLAGDDEPLLVCHPNSRGELADLMQRTTASLLLVRGEPRPAQRVLVALRGYGSDRAALDQTHQMLAGQPADITVLPLAAGRAWQPDRLLVTDAPARLHLLACMHALGSLPVTVRLRPGSAAEQLIAELSHTTYDLLVIAAEAWGAFVLRALDQVEAAGVLPDQPVLIVRPPGVAGLPAEAT